MLIVLLTIAPSGRSLSIDRALEVRRADKQGVAPPPELTPHWAYDLIAIQIAAIYLWAGLDKTDPAWLRGERMEHYWLYWYGSSDSLMLHPWGHHVAVLFAWATTAIELALAFGLLFRRTRPWVAPLGVRAAPRDHVHAGDHLLQHDDDDVVLRLLAAAVVSQFRVADRA